MKDRPMNRPPASTPEHVKARWWRENVVQMSRNELGAIVGVSASRILDIEAGSTRGSGAMIDRDTMTRYRMACAAVALGVEFDWTSCVLRPVAKTEIRIDMEIRPAKDQPAPE